MSKNKKIILCAIIIIFLLLLSIIGIELYQSHLQNSYSTLYSCDESFFITIKNSTNFKLNESDQEDYILDLYSITDQMILYTCVIDKNNYNLLEIVQNDKQEMLENVNNIVELSETEKLEIKDYEAYRYTYEYTNSVHNSDFYTQVVWIKAKNNIYVINLEVIIHNKEKYRKIFDEIIYSFTELERVS